MAQQVAEFLNSRNTFTRLINHADTKRGLISKFGGEGKCFIVCLPWVPWFQNDILILDYVGNFMVRPFLVIACQCLHTNSLLYVVLNNFKRGFNTQVHVVSTLKSIVYKYRVYMDCQNFQFYIWCFIYNLSILLFLTFQSSVWCRPADVGSVMFLLLEIYLLETCILQIILSLIVNNKEVNLNT